VSVFHRLNLLTGAADQLRHDDQWQYPAAAASPSTLISTAPQKQLPLYDLAMVPLLGVRRASTSIALRTEIERSMRNGTG
jgi:hypothetical protein